MRISYKLNCVKEDVMKKIIKLLIIIMIIIMASLFLLASCMISTKLEDYYRWPHNFPGCTYYCEDYDISFTVYEESFLINECEGAADYRSSIMGEMTVDGVKYEFYIDYSPDYYMAFTSKEIANEGVIDSDEYTSTMNKYKLLLLHFDLKRNGVIEATVVDDEKNILEAGTELVFYIEKK